MTKYSVSARQLVKPFGWTVALLTLMHIVLQIVRFISGDHTLMGMLAIFSLGSDLSIPGFYSAVAILVCALFLAFIAFAERRQEGYRPLLWLVLSAIFVFLSIDEMLSFHERLSTMLAPYFEAYPALHYAWTVPYGVAALALGIVYSRFLMGLPRITAALFLLGGGLFCMGAIGLELIGGYIAAGSGTANVTYVVFQTFEEFLEMAGILVFMYALADYAERRFGAVTFQLGHETVAVGSAAAEVTGARAPARRIDALEVKRSADKHSAVTR